MQVGKSVEQNNTKMINSKSLKHDKKFKDAYQINSQKYQTSFISDGYQILSQPKQGNMQ